ncbi:MAG: methyltransferase domain-containing protein [Actinomycetota bacterium]
MRALSFDADQTLWDFHRVQRRALEATARTMIERLIELAGWRPGDRIIEIGAGTGQLTIPLAQRGLLVTAIEPGPALCAELRDRATDIDRVEVVNALYEEAEIAHRAAGVVAANSLHWLEPTTAYQRIAGQLKLDGALALLWNFPVAATDAVQRELNERAWTSPLADLRRNLPSDTTALEHSLEHGRRELIASGHFSAPTWQMNTRREQWTIDRLARFCASLASTAGQLGLIVERLAALGLDEPIDMLDRVYTSVARRV